MLAGAFASRLTIRGVEGGSGGGGGELVAAAAAGGFDGAICIGVGRCSTGGGEVIVTPGGGASTFRRLLPGRGVIARTGSIMGACGRDRIREAGLSPGVAEGVVGGGGALAEAIGASGATVGLAAGASDAVGSDAAGLGAGVGVAFGFGVGVGFFFVVDLLRFLGGVGDGPVNIRLSLSPSVSPSQLRATPSVGMSAIKTMQTIRFTSSFPN